MAHEQNGGGYQKPPKGFATTAIHAGQDPSQWKSSAVVPPIITSTSFKLSAPDEETGYCYARSNNPTREVLEKCLSGIEDAKYTLTFGSGMGAITAITQLLSCGDHLLTSVDIYGGTLRLFRNVVVRMGIEISYVDFTDLESVENGLQPNTKMIWLESPTNPLCKVVDIAAVVQVARIQPGILVVTDNTFLTPYFQRPLKLGVDITMYSITKYINGHSDVIMGSASTNSKDLWNKLKFLQNATGIVPSPFDCYLVNRSLKTLSLRMEKHKANSLIVAEWLTKQPNIIEVMHPGLSTHRQHILAQQQSSGHSGVFSFRHKGGMAETRVLVSSLNVFALAESLGGYESIAGVPCLMSHASVPAHIKEKAGITDALIRLSVGLEDVEDLIADLEQAIAKAFTKVYANG